VAAYGENLLDAQGNLAIGGAVFSYETASNQHHQLSDPATWAGSPVTDGKRVAWFASPVGGGAPFDIWIAPVDGSSAAQRLSTKANGLPVWTDGLLVWSEDASFGAYTLKAYRNGEVTTLLTQFGAGVAAVGGGAVAYIGGKRLLVWTPQKGERLVHGLGAGSVAIADGWLYFTAGSALYRVPL